MPTTRPRHLLTESDDLRAALDEAAKRWPEDGDRPTALLLRLIDAGRRSVVGEAAARRAARLQAIEQASAGLEGVYPAGYLEELREDWPR